jgi:hypothetical protein
MVVNKSVLVISMCRAPFAKLLKSQRNYTAGDAIVKAKDE